MAREHQDAAIGRTALVVFARYPELGKVKTRLAAGITPAGALAFYKSCAEHVFRQVNRCAGVLGSSPEYRAALAIACTGVPCRLQPTRRRLLLTASS